MLVLLERLENEENPAVPVPLDLKACQESQVKSVLKVYLEHLATGAKPDPEENAAKLDHRDLQDLLVYPA